LSSYNRILLAQSAAYFIKALIKDANKVAGRVSVALGLIANNPQTIDDLYQPWHGGMYINYKKNAFHDLKHK